MPSIPLAAVEAIRARIVSAQQLAAQRFRDAFAAGALPPKAHLEIQAAALIECAEGVRVMGRIGYDVIGDEITPYVERGKPVYPYFDVERTPDAIFEYWLVVSEIVGSTAWRMTRVIATSTEYDEALRRMQSPQIVRAIVLSMLPSVEIRDDGNAMLEVTVYTRASEERIERRSLRLDHHNEFHYHGRALLAEGRGGVGGE